MPISKWHPIVSPLIHALMDRRASEAYLGSSNRLLQVRATLDNVRAGGAGADVYGFVAGFGRKYRAIVYLMCVYWVRCNIHM